MIRTQKAGDWKDCAVWPHGRARTPGPTDHVRLDHAIRLTKDQNIGAISLETNGSLDLNGFGIGFGGVDTSVCCFAPITSKTAADSYISLSKTASWRVDREWHTVGNISSIIHLLFLMFGNTLAAEKLNYIHKLVFYFWRFICLGCF